MLQLRIGVRVGIGFVVILLIGTIARPMFHGWDGRNAFEPWIPSRNSNRCGWQLALALFYLLQLRVAGPTLGRGKGLTLLVFTVLCSILTLTLLAS